MIDEIITLGYKNITPRFILERGQSFCDVRRQTETNRDGGRQRQTAILTHKFLAALWDAAPARRDWPLSSGRKLRLTQD